jgi:hypothetical protein
MHLHRFDVCKAVDPRNIALRFVGAHQPMNDLNLGEGGFDCLIVIGGHLNESAEKRTAPPKHS